jgi:hypothetical protein
MERAAEILVRVVGHLFYVMSRREKNWKAAAVSGKVPTIAWN